MEDLRLISIASFWKGMVIGVALGFLGALTAGVLLEFWFPV